MYTNDSQDNDLYFRLLSDKFQENDDQHKAILYYFYQFILYRFGTMISETRKIKLKEFLSSFKSVAHSETIKFVTDSLVLDFTNRQKVWNKFSEDKIYKEFIKEQVNYLNNLYIDKEIQNQMYKKLATAFINKLLEETPEFLEEMTKANDKYGAKVKQVMRLHHIALTKKQEKREHEEIEEMQLLFNEIFNENFNKEQIKALTTHDIASRIVDLYYVETELIDVEAKFIETLSYINLGRRNTSFELEMIFLPMIKGIENYKQYLISLSENTKDKTKSSKKNKTQFGRNEKDIKELTHMINKLHNKYKLLNKEKCSVDDLVTIIIAKNFDNLNKPIYFKCDTKIVALIFDNLKKYVPGLTLTDFDRYGKFFSRNEKIIKSGSLYQSKSIANEDTKDEIKKFFKQI